MLNDQIPPEQPDALITSSVEYAGFWRRFAASVIDGVLVVYFASSLRWVIADYLRFMFEGEFDYDEAQQLAYGIWTLQILFVRWCYFAGMESSPLQATAGKWLVGIQVVNHKNARISFGQATGRYFGKMLSGLILYIGYLMAGFSYRKQALHDQMANTFVTVRPPSEK